MLKYLDTTGLTYFWGKIKALVPTLSKKTSSIPFGYIDDTSTATIFTATVDGITELRDGVTVILVNNVIGSDTGCTLNINNLGAKPVYVFYNDIDMLTTGFTVGKTCMFVYDSTLVTGGCWKLFYPFPSTTTTTAYNLRSNYATLPSATACGRYRILFTSADDTKYVPANASTTTSSTSKKTVTTEKIDPFGKIVYYSTTTTRTAGQNFSAGYLYYQYYSFTLGYSLNTTGAALTLTPSAPVYIVCNPQTDGSALIDSTTPFTQTLPSTEDGKIYIYLGIARSATAMELQISHPVYYYWSGAIRLWAGNSIPDTSPTSGSDNYVTSGGVYTALQNKTDKVAIISSSGATLNAETGKYYRFDSAVGTLAITLNHTNDIYIQQATFGFTTDSTASVTFSPSTISETIYYADGFEIEASKTYEVNALWNGASWMIAGIILKLPTP